MNRLVARKLGCFVVISFLLLNAFHYAEAGNLWTNYQMVVGINSEGTWDTSDVSRPSVIKDGGTYKMWYSAAPHSGIIYCESTDGLTWTNFQQAVDRGSEGTWDEGRATQPTVIKDDSTYKMWYTGWGSNPCWGIIYCESSDGIIWTNFTQAVSYNSEGSWDSSGVWAPFVLKDAGTYKMWYSCSDGTNRRINYCESTDGMSWSNFQNSVGKNSEGTWDSNFSNYPSVVKDGAAYRMWYSGMDATGAWRIIYCTSMDGINWTNFSQEIGLSSEGTYDTGYAWGCSVIKDDAVYKMWYTGYDGTSYRIIYCENTAPSSPAGLVATPGDAVVTLDWNDNAESDLAGYNVYRSTTSGSEYSKINTSAVTVSQYQDTGLTNGMTYYYVVTAIDTLNNESGYSNEASAIPTAGADNTAPSAPSNFTAAAGDGQVSLSWANPSDSDFVGTKILRSTLGYPENVTADAILVYNSTGTSCTDTGLTNGTIYYYCAYAYDEVPNYSTAAQASIAPAAGGDNTAPDTTIISGPSGTIYYNDVTFQWTGSDNVTVTSYLVYSYKLEGVDSNYSGHTSSTSKSYNDLVNGSYTFYVKAKDETGNVDPTPASQSFTVSVQELAYSISGTVSDSSGGIEGVTVGADNKTTTTGTDGTYTISGLVAGTYTVVPSKSGYSFSPSSRTVTISTSNLTGVDFTGTVTSDPILSYNPTSLDFGTSSTSKILSISNNGGGELSWNLSVAEAWLSVTPDSGINDATVSVTVNRKGLNEGSYTGTISITSNGGEGSVIVAMKVGGEGTYAISGRVTDDKTGEGVNGVTVVAEDSAGSQAGSDTTGEMIVGDGYYTISGLSPGTYTITPSLSSCSFSPVSSDVTISTSDVGDVNFTAARGDPRVTLRTDKTIYCQSDTMNVYVRFEAGGEEKAVYLYFGINVKLSNDVDETDFYFPSWCKTEQDAIGAPWVVFDCEGCIFRDIKLEGAADGTYTWFAYYRDPDTMEVIGEKSYAECAILPF